MSHCGTVVSLGCRDICKSDAHSRRMQCEDDPHSLLLCGMSPVLIILGHFHMRHSTGSAQRHRSSGSQEEGCCAHGHTNQPTPSRCLSGFLGSGYEFHH